MEEQTTQHLVPESGMMVNVAFTSYPDGTVVAECTDIPGCISQGENLSEAKANIADAIAACLSVILEDALRSPEPQHSEQGKLSSRSSTSNRLTSSTAPNERPFPIFRWLVAESI